MLELLERILPSLEGTEVALIGSLNLQLQGVEGIEPKDIDFLTDDNGLQKIADRFQSEIGRDPDWGFKETHLDIEYNKIQFISYEGNDLREGTFPADKINISIEGLTIPCMSLESELKFYQKCNREKDKIKVDLINKKLSQTT